MKSFRDAEVFTDYFYITLGDDFILFVLPWQIYTFRSHSIPTSVSTLHSLPINKKKCNRSIPLLLICIENRLIYVYQNLSCSNSLQINPRFLPCLSSYLFLPCFVSSGLLLILLPCACQQDLCRTKLSLFL